MGEGAIENGAVPQGTTPFLYACLVRSDQSVSPRPSC